jgi:hypothetical protein
VPAAEAWLQEELLLEARRTQLPAGAQSAEELRQKRPR